MARSLLLVAASFLVVNPATAHPVAKDNHDRTIVVRFREAEGKIRVVVAYRLEVDEWTVVHRDMAPFRDEVDFSLFRNKPLEFYEQFTRTYAPILAGNLNARINGQEMKFSCVKREQRLRDEKDQELGHLRCDFVFETSLPLPRKAANEFVFREENFYLQAGQINLSLAWEAPWKVLSTMAPDPALKDRPAFEQDDNKLRTLTVTFAADAVADAPAASPPGPQTGPSSGSPRRDDHWSLLQLFRRTDLGLWLLVALAFVFGAAHALTPGHGKTLVAAYLVGERGTVGHAVFLGLVTTLTHTAVVLVLALVLFFLPETMSAETQQAIQTGLGLVMGLIVACLGIWLLLQRLSGRADHVHLPGHGHHHHHHGQHHHDPLSTSQPVGWWSLLVLGMTGGIIPCWDAIALLAVTVGSSQFWLALPLVLAFSAGLAGVLVAIGILVVKARRFAGSRWGEGRLVHALPIVSALLVAALGFWLCYESVHGRAGDHHAPAVGTAQP
jgi:ABC-type nickel/cobalt efflux system permease component RcnA